MTLTKLMLTNCDAQIVRDALTTHSQRDAVAHECSYTHSNKCAVCENAYNTNNRARAVVAMLSRNVTQHDTLRNEIINTLRAAGREMKRIELYRANDALFASYDRSGAHFAISCSAEHALQKLVKQRIVVRTRYAHYKLSDVYA